jgi:hypothetical protein
MRGLAPGRRRAGRLSLAFSVLGSGAVAAVWQSYKCRA